MCPFSNRQFHHNCTDISDPDFTIRLKCLTADSYKVWDQTDKHSKNLSDLVCDILNEKSQSTTIDYEILCSRMFEEMPDWKKAVLILYMLHLTHEQKSFSASVIAHFYTEHHLRPPENIHFHLYHACKKCLISHTDYDMNGEKAYTITFNGVEFADDFLNTKQQPVRKNTAVYRELYEVCYELNQLLLQTEMKWMSNQKTIQDQLVALLFLIKIKLRRDEFSSSGIQVILSEVFDINLSEKSIQSALSRLKPDVRRVKVKNRSCYKISRTGMNRMRRSIKLYQE